MDINEILADMLSAVKASVTDDWKQAKETASEFLQRRKERLELLADMRIQDEITQEFFEKRLNDEADILKAELHSVAILTQAAAQRAANAAIDVLRNAVSALLP